MPRIKCRSCDHGWITKEEYITCTKCKGRGETQQYIGGGQYDWDECTKCNGLGTKTKKRKVPCEYCHGSEYIDY